MAAIGLWEILCPHAIGFLPSNEGLLGFHQGKRDACELSSERDSRRDLAQAPIKEPLVVIGKALVTS